MNLRTLTASLVVILSACGSSGLEAGADGTAAIQSALSGPHYNLNIIGVPKEKSADMTGSNGHRIFVPLEGKATIELALGDFQVLDANGTDGTASFQLPNPDPDGDGVTTYSVYARALGKPGGQASQTTCLTDELGETYCSVASAVYVRSKGHSSFTNVTKDLLYVTADVDGDGTIDRVPLFGDATSDFFWSYDNNGLRIAQLRFYEVSTNTN